MGVSSSSVVSSSILTVAWALHNGQHASRWRVNIRLQPSMATQEKRFTIYALVAECLNARKGSTFPTLVTLPHTKPQVDYGEIRRCSGVLQKGALTRERPGQRTVVSEDFFKRNTRFSEMMVNSCTPIFLFCRPLRDFVCSEAKARRLNPNSCPPITPRKIRGSKKHHMRQD